MEALKRSLGFSTPTSDLRNDILRRQPSNEADDERNSVKVKTKLLSMWNNVKYGKTLFSLDTATSNFTSQAPVWLLGIFYHRKLNIHHQDLEYSIPAQQVNSAKEHDPAIAAFLSDFSSRIWLTYRREFEEFQGTTMNTDCGWGCMIRSGQMMVANALLIHHLGRNWRWKLRELDSVVTGHDVCDESIHRSIVRLFGDSPCQKTSPFSIHQLVAIADNMLDRKPGDWFGPAATAHLLKAALEKATKKLNKTDLDLLSNFRIYVSQDTTVFKQDILDMCVKTSKETTPNVDDINVFDDEEAEGFSILRRDSAEILITETGKNDYSALEVGAVAGVPYFSDDINFVKVERESFQRSSANDDDVTFVSLRGQISVDGEEWTIETGCDVTNDIVPVKNDDVSATTKRDKNVSKCDVRVPVPKVKRIYPSLSREIANAKRNVDQDNNWVPVLVLVPLRLGFENRLNPVYAPSLKALLADASCVGIIGGRPKHSLYFLGFQDDNLIHLDPHLVQDRVDVFRENFSLQSFHCSAPRKMALSKMDPSSCVGFLLTSRWQFDAWCEMTKDLVLPSSGSQVSYPMFTIEEGSSKDMEKDAKLCERIQRMESAMSSSDSNENSTESGNFVTEDFVFL